MSDTTSPPTGNIPYIRVGISSILDEQRAQTKATSELRADVQTLTATVQADALRTAARLRGLEERTSALEHRVGPLAYIVGLGGPVITGVAVWLITH